MDRSKFPLFVEHDSPGLCNIPFSVQCVEVQHLLYPWPLMGSTAQLLAGLRALPAHPLPSLRKHHFS